MVLAIDWAMTINTVCTVENPLRGALIWPNRPSLKNYSFFCKVRKDRGKATSVLCGLRKAGKLFGRVSTLFRYIRYRFSPQGARRVNLALHPPGEFISDQIRRTGHHYELDELLWAKAQLDFSKFVDIGANIGNHSNFFEAFGATGWAFEASAKNFDLLRENVRRFDCYHVALSDSDGIENFLAFRSSMGNSHVNGLFGSQVPKWGEGIEFEEVHAAPLDSYPLYSPTLMKIDVEGSELKVLRGARDTLRTYKPDVWIELHLRETLISANFPYSQEDIFDEFRFLGYKLKARLGSTNYIFGKR
jgi:FkbM family methyltransferase